MRTSLLSFFVFLLAINCNAEGAVKLAFSPSDSLSTTAQLPGGNGSIVVTQWVKNVSGGDIIVKWNIAGYNGESGWDYTVCATDSCFNFPPPAVFPEVPLAAGDSVQLIWEVTPYTQVGSGNCTCTFWVKGDSAQSSVKNFLKVNATAIASIQNASFLQEVKLFPNPTAAVLNIDFDGEESDEIEVINVEGEKVITGSFQKSISVAHLASGSYKLLLIRRSKVVGVANFLR